MNFRFFFPLIVWSLVDGWAAFAGIEEWSLPGHISWQAAQQPPFFLQRTFQTIDFRLVGGGIAPLDVTETVAVPTLSDTGDPNSDEEEAIKTFGKHVSRDSVFAMNAVVVGEETLVHAGDLLLEPFSNFPADPQEVRRLRQAGIDSIRALVNLMHAVLGVRDPRSRQLLLTSPTIFRHLGREQVQVQLTNLIDNDPETAFTRIDQPGRDVIQKGVVIFMDLAARFPIGLVRFYPRPFGGIRISGYRVDVNDGTAVIGGGGRLKDEPAFSLLDVEQNNTTDTVAVRLQPAQYLQRFRFESLTPLDFDIGEFEAFNQGFAPTAVYLSIPLPFDRAALVPLLDYLAGDLDRRDALARLKGPTLGRVFWEQNQVGDPSKSGAVVSLQTGTNPETQKLFRVNPTGAVVEWRPNAVVIDHREGVATSGSFINLDDEDLENAARQIWNALSDEERAAGQTTTPEYLAIPPGSKLDPRGDELPPELNRPFWSDFQPLTNGQLVTLPAGRPFFQLQVKLTSEDPHSATFVSNLRFELEFQTAAYEIKAEIVPAVDLTAGIDTTLIYAMRSHLEPNNVGFNRLRINTPTRVTGVEKVEFGYGGLTGLRRREAVEFREWARTDSFFAVGFPTIDQSRMEGDSLVVLVHFRARVLDLRTDFRGQVFLDTLKARARTEFNDEGMLIIGGRTHQGATIDTVRVLPQHIESGDVLDFSPTLSDRNSLQVLTSIEQQIEEVIARVRLRPNPFTPNGDGINDELTISYDVLRVTRPVPVTVGIFDLSGRQVGGFENLRQVGEYTEVWDGTRRGRDIVPPGIYMMKISAKTDTGEFSLTRLIALAY
ncbi:MAG: hypothetical protein HOC74_14075 [Gemmatimonadetes bacterium]|jgi:hypothetical protein|nr:hypothetical protein [Gemmatimonadota bacterium]